VLFARRELDLDHTAELCKQANAEIDTLVIPGDVTKEEDVNQLFQRTVDKFGASNGTLRSWIFAQVDYYHISQDALTCYST
jgi:NAD(P)-dependent dehydrogenase (short-subunit alcohol dehydrogenase family)